MTFNDFVYKAGLLKYLTLRVVMFAILVYTFAHGVEATEVTITTYGTDVVYNGETLKGNDNGSPVTYTVLDTKHVKKVFKHDFGDNVTTNTGDEDIIYAGNNASLVPEFPYAPDHLVFAVRFLDGPVVLYSRESAGSPVTLNGGNMPPWGEGYYETAAKLYERFLNGT